MLARVQDFIYGGANQSEKERARCSCTTDARMLLIAFLTYMSYVMYHAQRIAFAGVASSMTDEAGFTATKLGVMSTGYLFAYAIGQFACGRFADYVRPKRALVWGMFCCALLPVIEGFMGASGCGGEGGCYFTWVFVRILEGFAQATGWTSTVAIMGSWFPQDGRGLIMGLWATNCNVGDIFGLHVTSALLDHAEWYAILWVMASCTAFWAIVNMVFLRSAPPPFSLHWQHEEALPQAAVDQEVAGDSASLGQILCIPGLLQYSFSYMFLKLVNYALFLWLPFYLSKGIGVDKSLASLMSARFDVGFIVGAILAGLASDITSRYAGMPMRSPIVSSFLLISLLPMGVLRFSDDPGVIKWAIFFCGILQGGPADSLTSAVSVDLGKHPSLEGKRATSTVTGVINGTGAVGAAVGQYVVGMLSDRLGWKSVFIFLLVCLASAFALSLFRLCKELADVRAAKGSFDSASYESSEDSESVEQHN
ncbi:slc37a3 [Symbiodinium natans]|uniref:Slc37a3 protein n=1 Tax=Symbiodinium natans TaxID=878477 RepID=A0A812NK00_9DINO|nr:slc37a3 [Symbiodinium natans]